MPEKKSENNTIESAMASASEVEVKDKKATAKAKTAVKSKAKAAGEVTVTLIKSGIGKAKDQKATIVGLGFKRLNQTITLKDTPSVRGMISKISHLVEVQ